MTRRAAKLLMLALAILAPYALCAWAKPVVMYRSSQQYPSGYDEWIEQIELTADWHGDQWVDDTYTVNPSGFGQYEPWFGFRELARHLGGDAELEAQAVAAGDSWRDDYSIFNSGAVTGYYHYTDGLRVDWVSNADTTSRDALIDQAVSASYAQGSSSATMKDEAFSREVAYAVLGYINSEVYCGEAHNARMEPMIELMLAGAGASVDIGGASTLTDGGHIEQWLGDYTTDSSGDYVSGSTNFVTHDYAPFFAAITAHTLIRHYELAASINGGITPDVRTVEKLTRLADATWNECWEAEAGSQSMYLRPSQSQAAPVLNGMIFRWYAWLYKVTGEPRFKTRAEQLFNGMLTVTNLTNRVSVGNSNACKEVNQMLRWTFLGLDDYAEGVGNE